MWSSERRQILKNFLIEDSSKNLGTMIVKKKKTLEGQDIKATGEQFEELDGHPSVEQLEYKISIDTKGKFDEA